MGNRRYVRSLAGKAGLMIAASFLVIFAVQAVAAKPQVAEISEPAPGTAPLDPADVHMVAAFEDEDEDEHVCSQWEIRTRPQGELAWASDTPYEDKCMDGPEKIHIHLGDGEFMNSYEGRNVLKPEHGYSLRVRFLAEDSEGKQEWSDWSERWFDTRESGPVGSETRSWKAREGFTVENFAEDLRLPTKIAMVPEPGEHPDDPLMYVTELYGTVKVITNDGTVSDYKTDMLNFDPTGNFPGSGEKGLSGVVVEPKTGDLFVSLVYLGEDGDFHPKVLRLKSDPSGLMAVEEETVLDMPEADQGASHQVSELSLSPDGDYLFVHNGDGATGAHSAPDKDSYLGKILRMNLEGNPLPDNPFYDAEEISAEDYVWIKGIRNAFGGGFRESDGTYWSVENGPNIDRLTKVVKGEDYEWPDEDDMYKGAAYRWVPAHAPVAIRFLESDKYDGSGFPDEAMGHAFVTESGSTWATGPADNGKRIVEFALAGGEEGELATEEETLDSGPDTLAEYVGNGKATAVGLAAGPDGLYFTDLYKDTDYSSPVDRGANVLRVRYCGDDCPDEGDEEPEADEEAPSIERFRVWRRAFAPGLGARLRAIHRRSTEATDSRAASRGTAFVYRLSERSKVWIGIRPFVRGWEIGKRPGCHPVSKRSVQRLRKRGLAARPCVMPQARGVRRAGRCVPGSWSRGLGARLKRLRCVMRGPRGVIRGSGKPGRNVRIYAGRLGRRAARPGAYLVVMRARDLANNVAKPRYASFRVTGR